MHKKKLALICGGQNGEHEVSLQSANSISQNIDKKKWDLIILGVTKKGRLVTSENLILNSNDPVKICLNPAAEDVSTSYQHIAGQKIDVAFPIIHGEGGEDGIMQGFLKVLGIPFVGCNCKSAALTMDKHWSKLIASNHGINCGKFKVLKISEQVPTFAQIQKEIGPVIFIKPASKGSSLGVTKCYNEQDYLLGLKVAFALENKILLEKDQVGKELEIAVLGTNNDLLVTAPSQIISHHDFYSYDAKYIDKNGSDYILPAQLTAAQNKQIKELAIKIFNIFECSGLARIDFFLTTEGLIFNEINTIPGFTKISMYPKMITNSGINYDILLNKLLDIAILAQS